MSEPKGRETRTRELPKAIRGGRASAEHLFGLPKRDIAVRLRNLGINPTAQRTEIAFMLLEKAQHVSAEEVLGRLNGEYERVSQATVYNTLRLFVQKGLLRELVHSPERVYYDSNVSYHHHFYDLDTGEISDLPGNILQLGQLDSTTTVEEISVIVKGRKRRS